MTHEIEGEILNQMPAAPAQTQPNTSLVNTSNPFERMALIAMESGKVDQLDKLLDLQLKWDAEQQRKAFVSAMSDFKAEAGGITIAKAKRVSFKTDKGKTEYDHAELHDITRALVPVMAKHGLSHRWTLSQADNRITVECVVSHRDGHSERVTMSGPPDASGGKNAIQAIASTKSYLERYTFLAATGMATGGEIDNDGRDFDPAADDIEYVSDEQLVVLTDLVDAYIRKKQDFMDWISGVAGFKVETLGTVPAKLFDRVHAEVLNIKKRRESSDAS